MATETRARTTIEFRADARQIDRLGKSIKEAFNPAKAKDLNRAMDDTTKALGRNLTRTRQLNEALKGTKDGTRAYKELVQELRGANKEARTLEDTQKRLHSQAKSMAQGTTLKRPGLMARLQEKGVISKQGASVLRGAGGVATGGARRAAGSQAPTPTLQGMGTAATAIPFVGAAVAASLFAASGAYQSRLGWERAQLGAASGLMSPEDMLGLEGRAGDIRSGAAGAHQGELGRIGKQRSRLGTRGKAREEANILSDKEVDIMARSRIKSGMSMDQARQSVLNQFGQTETKEKRADINADARKLLDQQQGKADDKLAKVQGGAMGQALAEKMRSSEFRKIGGAFGMMPQEALSAAGGMGRAAGGISTDQFRFGMALKTAFGIDTEQTGTALRGLQYSGIEKDQTDEALAKVIAQGMALGLDQSEMSEHISKQTGFLKTSVMQGREANIGATMNLQSFLRTSTGMEGALATQRGQSLIGGFQGMGARGGGGAMQFRMMRAMGADLTSAEGYAKGRLDMQDPTKIAAALPKMIESFRGQAGGMGGSQGIFMMQQFLQGLPGMGDVTPDMARRIMSGDVTALNDVSGIDKGSIMKAGSAAAKAAAPALRGEAGIEAESIGVGGMMASTVQQFKRINLDLAGSIAAVMPMTAGFRDGLESSTTAIEVWTKRLMESGGISLIDILTGD